MGLRFRPELHRSRRPTTLKIPDFMPVFNCRWRRGLIVAGGSNRIWLRTGSMKRSAVCSCSVSGMRSGICVGGGQPDPDRPRAGTAVDRWLVKSRVVRYADSPRPMVCCTDASVPCAPVHRTGVLADGGRPSGPSGLDSARFSLAVFALALIPWRAKAVFVATVYSSEVTRGYPFR